MTALSDRLGFPPALRTLLERGTLRLISESPDRQSAHFDLPALREVDRRGHITTVELHWRNPATAGDLGDFDWHPDNDWPNFLLISDTTDLGDEILDECSDAESLVLWIEDAIANSTEDFRSVR